MNPLLLELIGYIGSAIVLISMMMSSVVKLRLINVVGGVISLIYCLLIKAYPTVVLNGSLVLINLFQLVRIAKRSDEYQLIRTGDQDPMFTYFLKYHLEDIKKYFPAFDPSRVAQDQVYVIHCNAVAAGLVVSRDLGDGVVELLVDYAIPQYRDYSLGQFLLNQLPELEYHKVVVRDPDKKNIKYLHKMGFVLEEGMYVKKW